MARYYRSRPFIRLLKMVNCSFEGFLVKALFAESPLWRSWLFDCHSLSILSFVHLDTCLPIECKLILIIRRITALEYRRPNWLFSLEKYYHQRVIHKFTWLQELLVFFHSLYQVLLQILVYIHSVLLFFNEIEVLHHRQLTWGVKISPIECGAL